MPRHPPFALDNLTTKMLASTVQFSTNDQPTTRSTPHQHHHSDRYARPSHAWQPNELTPANGSERNNHRLFFQDPTGCSTSLPSRTRTHPFPPPESSCTRLSRPLPKKNSPVSPPYEHPTTTLGQCGLLTDFRRKVLLRKEVIQPHLPVRLPCYDFVPIASPTFDGSLPYGLGHRLRVLPTFVT